WAAMPRSSDTTAHAPAPRAKFPPVSNSLSPVVEMVLVAQGQFFRGSPRSEKDRRDDESPRKLVKITRPFYLGKYEVTQGQYQVVMGTNPSAFSADGKHKKAVAGRDTSQHPVESVRWLDAIRFCNKLSEKHGLPPYYHIDGARVTVREGDGYRLPTEA